MKGEAWRLWRIEGIFLSRRGRKQIKAAWLLRRSDPWPVDGEMSKCAQQWHSTGSSWAQAERPWQCPENVFLALPQPYPHCRVRWKWLGNSICSCFHETRCGRWAGADPTAAVWARISETLFPVNFIEWQRQSPISWASLEISHAAGRCWKHKHLQKMMLEVLMASGISADWPAATLPVWQIPLISLSLLISYQVAVAWPQNLLSGKE